MSTNTRLTYYQRNRDVIFKKARDKYNKPEEKIKKITYEKNKYSVTEEQKIKRREYERNRNCNMTEEEKERRKEYARNRYHMMIFY